MSNFDPTDNTLAKAFQAENNHIKPIFNKQDWKGEVSNPSFDGLSNSIIESNKTVGVWGPISNSSHTLEELRGINQSRAISEIITQGFDEYYFVMSDFEDPKLMDSTESLLQSIENLDQSLKIIIILLMHLYQVAYYVTILTRQEDNYYMFLLKNENYPFRAFHVKITEEWRNNTKRRLILETRDIEDAIELNRPELARHVRFDDRYNWKCEGCSHKLECDEGLINEINLPKDARRWWDTYQKRSLEVKKRCFGPKNHRKMPRVTCTLSTYT